ncbi:glyoxalase/bleomycin resistance protein/dioxygenase [Lysobacter enzymogenes]|uniref:Glyoxalase/bleomycin resistance protein/dioxygenase n=1 Tax=Lysobacter enzymogenes TaxID=69 RepID=A0A0S2DKW0_LYSEN|nr:VOC family protein [Lysobacter enzymogenes]ALN59081.1 glyoxalase/bleomycin resistance protein/dioxygenase [Lysobacter enzymogenes]QCW27317.1 VOC family protein [Lysobacter enzymogenes]
MFHHLSLGVRDLARAGAFYDAVLGALGYRRVFDGDESIGYGLVDNQDLLLLNLTPAAAAPGDGTHLAFAAASRAEVDAFHRGGLSGGGRDNGAPGLRPDYGAHYYACFLIDPDGHRVEAVINAPASS